MWWPFRRRRPEPPAIPPSPHWQVKPVEPRDPGIEVDYSDPEWGVKTMATKIRAYWEKHQ